MERSNLEPYSAPGYMAYTKLETTPDVTKKTQLALLFKNPSQVYSIYQDMQNTLENTSILVNNELLKFEGVMKQDSTNMTLYAMAGVVIAIIVFTSIFVIRNSFSISISERLKQYGMLASMGATSKQIKKNVLFEAGILAAIAIPLGVLFGILAISITLMVVNPLLQSAHLFDYFDLTLSISWEAVAITVVVSVITILLSALSPARKAAKISPMEAIRETNTIHIRHQKLRTWKITQKLFGIEGEIASKNLKRSRKKYRTTIFSIFLSIVLFISTSSIISYGFKLSQLEYEKMEYNIMARLTDSSQDRTGQLQYFNQIAKLDGVKQVAILKVAFAKIPSTYLSSQSRQYNYYIEEQEDNTVYISLVAIGKTAYQKYIQELGLDIQKAKTQGILLDNHIDIVPVGEQRKRVEYRALDIQTSEKLPCQIDKEKEGESIKEDITILKITDKTPMYIPMQDDIATILISDEMMEQYDYKMDGIYLDTIDPNKVEENIKKIDESEKPIIYNYMTQQNENNSMVLIISIFLYGFIIVISLIGITNIFNTITTNMILRSKEFAILRSIGMKDKEFKKMIRYESILYGLKALLFGIPVGVLLSYLIYNILGNIYMTNYIFPIKEILICTIFVFCIIFMTMHYAIKKVEKQNMIETIRQENI